MSEGKELEKDKPIRRPHQFFRDELAVRVSAKNAGTKDSL